MNSNKANEFYTEQQDTNNICFCKVPTCLQLFPIIEELITASLI
jgi:hypothetical protein